MQEYMLVWAAAGIGAVIVGIRRRKTFAKIIDTFGKYLVVALIMIAMFLFYTSVKKTTACQRQY